MEIGVVVAGRNKHAWGDENLERLQRAEVTQACLRVRESGVQKLNPPGSVFKASKRYPSTSMLGGGRVSVGIW